MTVIVYLFRLISSFIVKYLIHQISKKIQYFDSNDSSNISKKSLNKNNKEMGEYIDYEEID